MGLLTMLLRDMQAVGELPAECCWKISVAMAPSNPAALGVLARARGDDDQHPLRRHHRRARRDARRVAAPDRPLCRVARRPRRVVRGNELAELVSVGAPLYAKFGLRNSRPLYPAGDHLVEEAVAIAREKVARAAVALEWARRLDPRARAVRERCRGLRVPNPAVRPETDVDARDELDVSPPRPSPNEEGIEMSGMRKLLAATAGLAVVAAAGGGAVVTSAHSAPAALAAVSATGCTSSKGTLKYGIAGAGIAQLDPNTINFAGQAPMQTLLYNGLAKYDRNMRSSPTWRRSGGVGGPEDLVVHAPQGRRSTRRAAGSPPTTSGRTSCACSIRR